MPYKPARPCKYPGCINTTKTKQGYCDNHIHLYKPFIKKYPRQPDNRPSAAVRGYDRAWQVIRLEVLNKAGIPKDLQHLYDVHHEPPYNAAVEPNHRAYTLIPLLKSEHSRVTGKAKG